MTTYTKFIEVNEHEGETWMFYFQDDEEVINALNILTGYTENFEVYGRGYTEEQVDFIIEEVRPLSSYMNTANKVRITDEAKAMLLQFVVRFASREEDEELLIDSLNDFLYKGNLFTK